jgi:hypothetical protein
MARFAYTLSLAVGLLGLALVPVLAQESDADIAARRRQQYREWEREADEARARRIREQRELDRREQERRCCAPTPTRTVDPEVLAEQRRQDRARAELRYVTLRWERTTRDLQDAEKQLQQLLEEERQHPARTEAADAVRVATVRRSEEQVGELRRSAGLLKAEHDDLVRKAGKPPEKIEE